MSQTIHTVAVIALGHLAMACVPNRSIARKAVLEASFPIGIEQPLPESGLRGVGVWGCVSHSRPPAAACHHELQDELLVAAAQASHNTVRLE